MMAQHMEAQKVSTFVFHTYSYWQAANFVLLSWVSLVVIDASRMLDGKFLRRSSESLLSLVGMQRPAEDLKLPYRSAQEQ